MKFKEILLDYDDELVILTRDLGRVIMKGTKLEFASNKRSVFFQTITRDRIYRNYHICIIRLINECMII
jgi:hypothetical protein